MIIKNNKELKQRKFKNEKELQIFFEKNIKQILNYTYVETEFSVDNFRIDTLAFDDETKSFRIIEYKNVKNQSLVDQGLTYLGLMLDRKADFVLRYNENNNKNLKLKDVDWSQSRILFVSPTFTPFQLNAADFKDLPIDLVRVTKYEGEIIDIDFIKKESSAKIDSLANSKQHMKISKEIKVYEEEDHIRNLPSGIVELYRSLKEIILNLGDIDIDVKKYYIAFKGTRNIVDVQFTKKKLWVYINMKKGTLKDPMKIAQDCSKVGHWANGDYKVEISKEEDIDALIPLVKQSLEVNGK